MHFGLTFLDTNECNRILCSNNHFIFETTIFSRLRFLSQRYSISLQKEIYESGSSDIRGNSTNYRYICNITWNCNRSISSSTKKEQMCVDAYKE